MQPDEPIVITMEGGLITSVCAATPGRPVVIINYDRDDVAGAEPGDESVLEVPQGEGRGTQGIVRVERVDAAWPHIAEFAAALVAAELPEVTTPAPDAPTVHAPWEEPDEQQLVCPKCGSGHVTVAATVWVKVDVDCELDQVVGSGYEYDDASPVVCRSCGERGAVATFDPDGPSSSEC